MITYLDASVLLRVILGQTPVLSEWHAISRGVTSSLVRVECSRAIERVRLLGITDDATAERQRVLTDEMLTNFELIDVDAALARAAKPIGQILGALDAIHLATALLYRDAYAPDLVFATHDRALAAAARAAGMAVIGAA